MKGLILMVLSLALAIYGWVQISDYAWTPAGAPRWNPLAIKESGFGRTLARILTEQANTSYHHGLLERKPPLSTNPLSHWLDEGGSSLGFQGRLYYRPVEKYPLRPYEVKQALDQVEKDLRLAFELDPGNYTAYDVYLFFLTNEVTQTEFASLGGAQFKDDDDDSAAPSADTPGPADASPAPVVVAPPKIEPAAPTGVFKLWADQERKRRHARAIEITDEAIRKFRPNTMDPERFLTAAVMWYNRLMLVAPEVDERQKSAEARKQFEEVGPPSLAKITYYLEAAKTCQLDLEKKGLWQAFPERRAEYFRVMQLLQKCAYTVTVALQNNRIQMAKDQPNTAAIWGPLGKN
jgi:hypothetical protein